jgi:hypothetical protein
MGTASSRAVLWSRSSLLADISVASSSPEPLLEKITHRFFRYALRSNWLRRVTGFHLAGPPMASALAAVSISEFYLIAGFRGRLFGEFQDI